MLLLKWRRPSNLARRARQLAMGDFRVVRHLIDMASDSEPASQEIHEIRASIYMDRRADELSLMAKGIFESAANESRQLLGHEIEPGRRALSLEP